MGPQGCWLASGPVVTLAHGAAKRAPAFMPPPFRELIDCLVLAPPAAGAVGSEGSRLPALSCLPNNPRLALTRVREVIGP